MKKIYLIILFLFNIHLFAQNTVGILTNDVNAYDGYTLFSPNFSTETYLLNNCGEIVHQWTSTFTPAASVYLLENGNLLRTGKIDNTEITFGGVGGKIELFDWDNNLLWEYTYSSTTVSQHHDIYPLNNGNILMLAVTTMSQLEAENAGRNPSLILDGKVFNEQIIELQPILGTDQANIAWEWNIKDHLIQDYDSNKANHGVIADHPELLDFNFLNENNGNANWLHFNSIQYNETLEQIVISSRLLDEIYIIDHTTTTTEAASHSGGTYGKGGDFLYRWGNPQAYDHGDSNDRTLFSQHYPHWIPDGLTDAGKLMIFNNGNAIRYSSVDIVSPPTSSPGVYTYDMVNGYGPLASEWKYTAPTPEDFFSSILSSGQRLPNGNTLICDGDSGYLFEIDPSENIVWEYINPDAEAGISTQGDTPPNRNFVFRALKFSKNYPAFDSKDLTPIGTIENGVDMSGCTLLSTYENITDNYKIHPNPVRDKLHFKTNKIVSDIKLFDMVGNLVKKSNFKTIDMSQLSNGLYIAQITIDGVTISEKIVKH